MFPTHVGMNRSMNEVIIDLMHVPHTRGDEPLISVPGIKTGICSPHTWG